MRLRLRLAARNAKDTTEYTNAQIDIALDDLFADFILDTRIVKTSATIDFDADENEADFSDLEGFLATRIERARVDRDDNYTDVSDDLDIVPIGEVLDSINADDSDDTPTKMAFEDSVTAKFFPVPSDDGSITVVYSPLQIGWETGTMGTYSSSVTYQVDDVVISSGTLYRSIQPNSLGNAVSDTAYWENLGAGTLLAPASVESAIPDGILGLLIKIGGPPFLQNLAPEHQAATIGAMQAYQQFKLKNMGVGSLGGKSSSRARLRCR